MTLGEGGQRANPYAKALKMVAFSDNKARNYDSRRTENRDGRT